MARLISFSYTYQDDNNQIVVVNNADPNQIHAVARSFILPPTVDLKTYNKQQNAKTRNLTAA